MTPEKLRLIRWANTDAIVSRLQNEIKTYQDLIDDSRDISGLAMDGMPHGTEPGNPTERKAFKAMALEETYSDYISQRQIEIEEALANKRMVDEILDRHEPLYRDICEMRYMKKKKWMDIAFASYYSEGYIKNLYAVITAEIREALQNLTN